MEKTITKRTYYRNMTTLEVTDDHATAVGWYKDSSVELGWGTSPDNVNYTCTWTHEKDAM